MKYKATAKLFWTIVMSCLAAHLVEAHDVFMPCWRGLEGTTFQEWRFDSGLNPATPERATNNYGAPLATVTPGVFGQGWFYQQPSLGIQTGYWNLWADGTIQLSLPNRPAAPATSCKYVSIQVAQFIDSLYSAYAPISIPGAVMLSRQTQTIESISGGLGGAWMVEQTTWRIEPNPSVETVTITGGAPFGSVIDQIVVDTICITNASTYVDAGYAASDCTSVGWPNTVAPIDKPLGLLAFASFQTGVDRAPAGGIVNVAPGSYAAANINKAVTVNLGPATAQATVAGLALGATASLAMDVNGVSPGTQHDQWTVSGTVILAGSLTVSSGAALGLNDTVTLINNTGPNAVVGTFAGLPQGATNNVGGQQFTVSYTGGSGNDVVLTMVNHAPIPGIKVAATYVNLPATNLVGKLLGAATDPDVGDTVTFVAPHSPSAEGGSVVSTTLSGAPAIAYTPPPNFIGTDLVYYTITDGKAVSTGTITVSVLPNTGITFNMLPLVISNNLPFIQFAGVRGYTYELQRSPTLAPPDWETIATIFLPADGIGIGSFYDTGAPGTNAFYRTHLP